MECNTSSETIWLWFPSECIHAALSGLTMKELMQALSKLFSSRDIVKLSRTDQVEAIVQYFPIAQAKYLSLRECGRLAVFQCFCC